MTPAVVRQREVVVSEISVAPIDETPKFKAKDLVTFRGYSQGAISFVLYGTATGAVYFVVAPLFAAMLPDVKWSLGVISTALLIRGLLSIVVSPLTGWLVSRLGVRPVVMFGTVFTAAFTALTGTVNNPVEFGLVFGVALSVADSFMGFIAATTVVHRWFMSRRGVVMGFVNSGAGFGGLIFAPLMSVLVAHFGWRHALYVLACIILVLGIPSIWLRNKPQDVGQWVDGVPGRVIPEAGHADAIGTVQATLKSMARSPLYWAIFAIFGIESWALGVYAADQVLYLQTIGVGTLTSSGALGTAAGIAAVSGIVFSRLSDRTSPYFVLIGSTTLMALGSIAFLSAHNTALLWIYSALFGAGYGLTVPTIPVALSRYFGALDFSKAFGLGQILSGTMAGLGPWVTGQIVDHTGSYRIPIYLITGLLLLAVAIAIAARPRTRLSPTGQPVIDPALDGYPAEKLLASE
jgi:MFS family permease